MKPVLLILDGPDATGKTTYAETFQRMFPNTTYEHLTYIKDNREMFMANYRALLKAEACLRSGRSFILDRGWMSENIYSRVYRGGSGLSLHARILDRIIRRLGGLYIMATPHPDSAAERHRISCQNRSEMYLPGPEIHQVARLYYDLTFGTKTYDGLVMDDYVQDWIRLGGFLVRPDVEVYDIDIHGASLPTHIHCAYARALALQESQIRIGGTEPIYGNKNFLGHVEFASVAFVGSPPASPNMWPMTHYDSWRWIEGMMSAAGVDECGCVWTSPSGPGDFIDELASRHFTFVATTQAASRDLAQRLIDHKVIYDPALHGSIADTHNHRIFTSI